MRPFWRYYGAKWRAAPKYPSPEHRIVVEPFAGAAGYAMAHPDRDVILIDKYPVIVGIWDYLIRAKPSEVRAIPLVEAVDDLPAWVPQGARDLVGFNLSSATVSPCRVLSAGARRMAARAGGLDASPYGWGERRRAIVADQVDRIKHWTVRLGSYADLGNADLAKWCRARQGQVIVCENAGADWLPFKPFGDFQRVMGRAPSREVIWTNPCP